MNREYGQYLVTGKRRYRGHEPGSTFEAQLAPGPEARAISRGDIRLLRKFTPSIEGLPVTFPKGWLDEPSTANHQAREGG